MPPTTRTCSSPPASCTTSGWAAAPRDRLGSEVEGADLAATVLIEHGVAAAEVDRVWEAIALHSSVGIAHRRGLLTSLTHRGVFIDSGRDTGLPAGQIQRVRTAYPHRAGKRYLADAIADHASRSEAAAPPGSLGFELLRQRRAEAALKR